MTFAQQTTTELTTSSRSLATTNDKKETTHSTYETTMTVPTTIKGTDNMTPPTSTASDITKSNTAPPTITVNDATTELEAASDVTTFPAGGTAMSTTPMVSTSTDTAENVVVPIVSNESKLRVTINIRYLIRYT